MSPDELRAAAKSALSEIHGQDPKRQYSVAEVKRIVYSIVDASDLLADVIKFAENVENPEDPFDFGGGGQCDIAQDILRIARGETNNHENGSK